MIVITGLVPVIRVLSKLAKRTWMAGTSSGHDNREIS